MQRASTGDDIRVRPAHHGQSLWAGISEVGSSNTSLQNFLKSRSTDSEISGDKHSDTGYLYIKIYIN